MDITLRLEEQDDYRIVEELTREAFWDVYKPGCDEHLLLHKMRTHPGFMRELDYVAECGNTIVGHIAYLRNQIRQADGSAVWVLMFGPVSVHPDHQHQGIGSKLIRHTLNLVRTMDYPGVVIFGDPDYYHRFGFQNAQVFQITMSNGDNIEPFMAIETRPNGFLHIRGSLLDDPVYQSNDAEVEAFDLGFPPKEKHVTDTQL